MKNNIQYFEHRAAQEAAVDLNPQYVRYCQLHAGSVQDMQEYDEIHWPGGSMVGYISWIHEVKELCRKELPDVFLMDSKGHPTGGVANFDVWHKYVFNTNHILSDYAKDNK